MNRRNLAALTVVAMMAYPTLGEAPQGEAIASLIEQLDNRSFPEREAAARKLEDIGEPALPALQVTLKTGKSLEIRRRAERVMEAIEKRHIRPRALRAVERFQDRIGPDVEECIPDLVWLLRDDDSGYRAGAILARWGAKHPQSVVPVLLRQAEQGTSPTRRRAIGTLESIGPKAQSAVPVLIRLLADQDPWVRSRAVQALSKIGDKAAIPGLRTALATDGNYDVRRRAATALEELGPNPDVVPALIQALKDNQKLLNSLELTETNPHKTVMLCTPKDRLEHRDLAQRAAHALVAMGPPALPALRELLKDQDLVVRWQAVHILHCRAEKSPQWMLELLPALDDPVPEMRLRAADYLGSYGPRAKAALPKLHRLLNDPVDNVRITAANAMLAMEPNLPQPLPALQRALQSQDAFVRASAANILGRVGPRAKASVPALLELLTDKEEYVRNAAAEALKEIDPQAAAKASMK